MVHSEILAFGPTVLNRRRAVVVWDAVLNYFVCQPLLMEDRSLAKICLLELRITAIGPHIAVSNRRRRSCFAIAHGVFFLGHQLFAKALLSSVVAAVGPMRSGLLSGRGWQGEVLDLFDGLLKDDLGRATFRQLIHTWL